jgi:hypothetical protein
MLAASRRAPYDALLVPPPPVVLGFPQPRPLLTNTGRPPLATLRVPVVPAPKQRASESQGGHRPLAL